MQQQLFTLTDRKYCDFMVCAISPDREPQIVRERIFPDLNHWHTVVPKLETFWRISVLPKILGRWYTRKCTLPVSKLTGSAICFCRGLWGGTVITRSNTNCPDREFHPSCLAFNSAMTLQISYCSHCSRLPQFKNRKGRSASAKQCA